MRVSHHAAERFLQRVFHMDRYSRHDINRARKLLQRDVSSLVVTGVKRFVPLPSFQEAVALYLDGTLVTVYPREYVRNYLKDRRVKH